MKKIILIASLLFCNLALADTKTVELIVPFAPGGTASVVGHITSEMLNEGGVPTAVINKPGADSVIGVNYAAKAEPNGQTLLIGTTSSLVANIVFDAQGVEYNEKSFAPVVMLAKTDMVLISSATAPFKNYEQFKFYIKANPDKFNVGSFNSNLTKLWVEWAAREGLPKPNVIMYKGSAQVLTDVVGGHLLLGADIWTSTIPFYKANKINVVATTDAGIIADMKKINPNTNAVNISTKYPDLKVSIWYGLFAPAGTSKTTINNLNGIINRAFKDPKYQEKIQALDVKEFGGTPEALSTLQTNGIKALTRIKN